MAEQYDNTNRGALFKNKKKESDNHPDYTGTINVKGTEQYVSAWINTSKAGETYLALKTSDPKPLGEQPVSPAASQPSSAPLADEIPF